MPVPDYDVARLRGEDPTPCTCGRPHGCPHMNTWYDEEWSGIFVAVVANPASLCMTLGEALLLSHAAALLVHRQVLKGPQSRVGCAFWTWQ